MATLALPTPAQRSAPPRPVARACLNGHLAEARLPAEVAIGAPTNRADPLAVESPRRGDAAHAALLVLDRQRDGSADDVDVRTLTDTFRTPGGSDWDLATQILAVVLPADRRAGLDLRGAFSA